MDKTVVEQKIYKYEQGYESKQNPWTIGELKNAVVNSESINNYYCTDKPESAWLFADTEEPELDNELWRKCETYTYYDYEIYASNRGRIKVNGEMKDIYKASIAFSPIKLSCLINGRKLDVTISTSNHIVVKFNDELVK